MSNNVKSNNQQLSKILLEKNFKGESSKQFLNFSIACILKKFRIELDNDQIEEQIIDGYDDLGIDAFIILLNDEVIFSEDNLQEFTNDKNIHATIILIQSKYTTSFELSAIEKISANLNQILILKNDENLKSQNPFLNEKIKLFSKIITTFFGSNSQNFTLDFKIYYCTIGEYSGLSSKPEWKRIEKEISKTIKHDFNFSTDSLTYLGFQELNKIFSYTPINIKSLTAEKYFIEEHNENKGLVATVKLKNYLNFLIDENTMKLEKTFFEDNVRDYQNNTEINKEIKKSLETKIENDFWWLNNGITILVDKLDSANFNKIIKLTNPQIVNGLQTSYSLFFVNSQKKLASPEQKILIKILEIKDIKQSIDIIAASNNQNSISKSALKAADSIQKEIEIFLSKHGYNYERRKKYYSNKNMKNIISIEFLAQCYVSIFQHLPSKARTSTKSLFKSDFEYKNIFNKDINYCDYLKCIRIGTFIKENITEINLELIKNKKEKNIKQQVKKLMKFHCMYIFYNLYLKKIEANQYEKFFTPENLLYSFNLLYNLLKNYMKQKNLLETQIMDISKKSDFDNFLKENYPN